MVSGRLPIERRPAGGAREELWRRQGGVCASCGGAMPLQRFDLPHATLWKKYRPTVDHIRPLSKGGQDEIGNLQLVHASCNLRKGDLWRP